jgi:tetratricopeptide (TPR) repeat protein
MDSDGKALWARSFEGALDDVFSFQDAITANVVAFVEPAIEAAEIRQSRRERPESIAAYDLYLRGREAVDTFLPTSNAVAYDLFRQALALEPDNILFLAGAALAIQHRIGSGWPPIGNDDWERCAEIGRRGLALVGNDAVSMALFGSALVNAFHRDVGLISVNRAVELNPNSLNVLVSAGFANYKVGSLDDSDAFYRRALVLSPEPLTQRVAMTGVARGYIMARRYAEARDWALQSLAVSEGYSGTFGILIAANAHLGRMDEARRHLARFQTLAPGVTLARIAASWGNEASPNPYPERIAPILEGLKTAGMS